jgi:hypothetical protein
VVGVVYPVRMHDIRAVVACDYGRRHAHTLHMQHNTRGNQVLSSCFLCRGTKGRILHTHGEILFAGSVASGRGSYLTMS